MSWPTMTDYQEAVQNPRLCFADPELQQGSQVLDRLGLPRPVTGGFASVYQMNCGGRKYAVRCFLHYHADQEQRYIVIHRYLKQAALSCMVEFEFLTRGIKVGNQWYPVLKMEWADGEPLNRYIEKNLHRPQAMQDLARRLLELAAGLRRHSVAHGDLQHGNILVANGELTLIDYDGMYVPGLGGMSSHELGHRNYQHPARNEKDFGPGLDNFSVWVIYLSLLGLGADPSLWKRSGAGDEQLLLHRKDFENPAGSTILSTLKQIRAGNVQSLAASFISFTRYTDLFKIPPPAGAPLTQPAAPIFSASNSPKNNTPPPGPSWVLDCLETVSPVQISHSCLVERLLLGVFAVASAIFAHASASGLLTFTGALSFCGGCAMVPLLLALRFCTLPEVLKKLKLRASAHRLHTEVKRLENLIKQLEYKRQKLTGEETQKIDKITAKQRDLARRKKDALTQSARDLQNILAELNHQRKSLEQAEAYEMAQELFVYQNRFLPRKLAGYDLPRASIQGIGPETKKRLVAAGIRTAADIINIHTVQSKTVFREMAYVEVSGRGKVYIEGLGPQKAKAILAWRLDLESKFKNQMPTSMPSDREAKIKSTYEKRSQALDTREQAARQNEQRRKETVREKFLLEKNTLIRQSRRIRKQYAIQRRDLDQKISEEAANIVLKRGALAKLQQELDAFQQVCFTAYLKRIFCRVN